MRRVFRSNREPRSGIDEGKVDNSRCIGLPIQIGQEVTSGFHFLDVIVERLVDLASSVRASSRLIAEKGAVEARL
jgi:hypothetical protein